MAYKATLEALGKKKDVLNYKVELYRTRDSKNRVASRTQGGDIKVTVEATDDTAFLESITNGIYKPFSGKLEFRKPDDEGVMRTVEFEKGFVVQYMEDFDTANEKSMTVSFVIAAQTIKSGNAEVKFEWAE